VPEVMPSSIYSQYPMKLWSLSSRDAGKYAKAAPQNMFAP